MEGSRSGRTGRRWMLVATLAVLTMVGCRGPLKTESVARPVFRSYQRVAVWAELTRPQEELFLPLYMQAFPRQQLIERRDLAAVIGEQDILPDRLDAETRAKLRALLGVEAIIYPHYTGPPEEQLSLKVIDTARGEIVAAIVVYRNPGGKGKATDRTMIRKAIDTLEDEVY